MIEPLNKKYVKMVAKIVYEGLSLRNLTDHALQYKSRYHGREGFKFRNDHNLANDIVKSVLKNPQSSKIAVAGYEMKADGRVRYVAYAYSPAMSDAGVAKIITADTQYPPTKFLQPQILTTYRERLTSGIKQMLDEVMPIYYIMEGKTDDEYRAEQEMLRDIQVDVPNMEKLHGKYFEIRSKRNKIDKSIARLFDAAEGNYLDVPYESMKDLVLSRSKMNKTLDKIHQMIRRIKPNFKEPEVVVNTIPSDEYESLVKEYIEAGAKQYDKMFAEYMTPEDVEEVNANFKSLDEKLATSVPAQTEGVARMESMEAQYEAFIESVCAEFDCTDAICPLQEGFVALCEADMGDIRNGSAWDTVEWIHVNHAAYPRMDMDIKLDSLWATRQKDSATRQDVIGRFIEDAEDFNKWLATSEDGGAFITSALIKFKGEPDAVAVDIPCPGGVEDLVSSSRNSLQESVGSPCSPEIPASFCPTTGVQAKVDAKLRQLGIVVDWPTYTPSRNRSWASQGMPSGTASAYTVSEAEEAGSYILDNKRTICFYVSVSELARTPVDMYDVDTSMGSDYREIGVDTKFVPPLGK